MTIARREIVDPKMTRWYHCVSRCVRRAFLLEEGDDDRRLWLENRLEELSKVFAVAVGGFSVMENHLHLLLRLDPHIAEAWTNEDVVRRWGELFPPRDKSRRALPVSEHWVQSQLANTQWVATARERLQSISWFMKCLKEPLSRMANRQDDVRGAFWEGRFKSVAVLEEETLLATSLYIDLNPVAAKAAETPETSEYTSIKQRLDHAEAEGKTAQFEAANGGSVAGSMAAAGIEESHWLCPIEDRRGLDSPREGMFQGFSLGSYAKLIDYTGRLLREGKASMPADLASIFERLGCSDESWKTRMEKLSEGNWFGQFFAATRAKLHEIGERFDGRRLVNLARCPVR